MTNEDIIKLGQALTSIAVAANTIYNVTNQNIHQDKLPDSGNPTAYITYEKDNKNNSANDRRNRHGK